LNRTQEAVRELSLTKNDWPQETVDGLTLLFSPLLRSVPGLVHAFTTRLGGQSPEPLDNFNLGRHWHTDESRTNAIHNRARLCAVLGIDVNRLMIPAQIHSSKVAWATEPTSFPDVDAVATVSKNTPILLHYADCVPIILVDKEKNALCVLHAGWRGTAGGIATHGVEKLVEMLGSNPSDMVAAVGPAIGSCCYPTGEDVAEQLESTVKDKAGLIDRREGQPRPDLKAVNARQLLEAGVSQVDVSAACTACNPELFYSHRRFAGKTGRQGAIGAVI
jgi:YfiH family protein